MKLYVDSIIHNETPGAMLIHEPFLSENAILFQFLKDFVK